MFTICCNSFIFWDASSSCFNFNDWTIQNVYKNINIQSKLYEKNYKVYKCTFERKNIIRFKLVA